MPLHLKKNYLFISKSEWQKEGETETKRPFILWLIPQVASTSNAEPGSSQEFHLGLLRVRLPKHWAISCCAYLSIGIKLTSSVGGQVGCQRDWQLCLLSHSASHGTAHIVFSTHYLLNSSEEPEVSKLEPDKPADVITDDLENFKISQHGLHVHTQAHMCIYMYAYTDRALLCWLHGVG